MFPATKACDLLQKAYYLQHKKIYLTTYLETALLLNCTRVLNEECSHRHMSYTKFTDLVYDRTCDRTRMIQECLHLIPGSSKTPWEVKVKSMKNLTMFQLQTPCVQIALYDRVLLRHNSSYGMFHEASVLNLPFCNHSWCGLDDEHKHLLSPGFCLSQTRFFFLCFHKSI